MRMPRAPLAGVAIGALIALCVAAPSADARAPKPAKPAEYGLGVGIYAGGETFVVQCDDRRTWDGVGEFGESDVINTYVADEPGRGKFRIEPRAKNWGEQDLIAQVEVYYNVPGTEEGRTQQWQQQWHLGPYSNRAGQDSELAQIEQAYWEDLRTVTGDPTAIWPREGEPIEYEVYMSYQLGSQDSEPVAKCEAEIVVQAG